MCRSPVVAENTFKASAVLIVRLMYQEIRVDDGLLLVSFHRYSYTQSSLKLMKSVEAHSVTGHSYFHRYLVSQIQKLLGSFHLRPSAVVQRHIQHQKAYMHQELRAYLTKIRATELNGTTRPRNFETTCVTWYLHTMLES